MKITKNGNIYNTSGKFHVLPASVGANTLKAGHAGDGDAFEPPTLNFFKLYLCNCRRLILVLKYFVKHSRVNILFKGVVGAEGVKQSADAAVRVQNLHRRIVPNLDSTVQFVNKAPGTLLEFVIKICLAYRSMDCNGSFLLSFQFYCPFLSW